MILDDIYTELIAEHNRSPENKKHILQMYISLDDINLNPPENKKHLENATSKERGHNPSCGDEITLELEVADNIIKNASFTGVGCAISQASTDMMIDLIKGKTVNEAKRLTELFIAMIKGEVTDDTVLEDLDDAAALKNIANMPARVKCATLAWHTLLNSVDKNDRS